MSPLDGGGGDAGVFNLDIPLDFSSTPISSATAINGELVFGEYPNASPIVTTNTGGGDIKSQAATGPLASAGGFAWWQWLIIGGIAWGVMRGKK